MKLHVPELNYKLIIYTKSIHSGAFYFGGGWRMKLNKQEQAVAIGTFISMLGQELVNDRIDKQKLESVLPIFNEMQDNTTPKQKREAMISLLEKAVEEFLK